MPKETLEERKHAMDTHSPGDSFLSILKDSEDPDEMPQNAAFYQGLNCLLRQKNDQ